MSDEYPYREVLSEASRRAHRYLEHAPSRSVFPTTQALSDLQQLGGPMPDAGEDPVSVLKLLDECGSPATVVSTGGRYFGFVVGGALPVTVGAHWLADAWDQNVCLYALSPVGAYLEEVVLGWIIDLLGFPSHSAGALVTGAQMANLTCLAAARHEVLRKAGWDVESHGLFGAPPITVVVGEEVHATVLKALALLGLGKRRLVIVPTDAQGRMIANAIPPLDGPAIICTQAGNVNSGAFDPVSEISEIAHASGAWVHVDGAFGLWAATSPQRKHLTEGAGQADSWATDAHKWLNVPQDSGVAIVRYADALRAAMAISGAYLHPGEHREPMHWTPESSRRARGIEIWAALRSLGRKGLADLIERTCGHAAKAAARLKAAGFEVLNEVVLNQVVVSFGDEEATQQVIRNVQADGTCWCGGTVWRGRAAMRISVSSWATADEDMDRSLSAIIAIARTSRKAYQA